MGYELMTKKTPRRYEPYELISALQKFVRRSMEEEAMFCFLELESHGLYHIAKNRLMVIVYEDVGIGNPSLANSIGMHIEQMDKWFKAKNGAWRLVLSYIILEACRGTKDRTSDQFVCAIAGRITSGWRVNLDDYDFVFDKHTRKGKKMGRGIDHFYDEASKIINSPLSEDYKEEERGLKKSLAEKKLDFWDFYKMKDDEQEGLF